MDEKELSELGLNPIGAELRRRGWSQGDLAERLGTCRMTVSRWCTGRNIPSIGNARKIAKALDLSLEEVYSDAA